MINNNKRSQQNEINKYDQNNIQIEDLKDLNQVAKNFEFSGPECWINFKFDYNSIIQDLPPIFDL